MFLAGVQLAFGTTVEQPQAFGPTEKREIPPSPMAVAALLLGVAGVGLSLKSNPEPVGLLRLAASAALIMLQSQTNPEALQEGGGLI